MRTVFGEEPEAHERTIAALRELIDRPSAATRRIAVPVCASRLRAGAYRRRIENRIRAGNTTLP
jgi:hypothetical protein